MWLVVFPRKRLNVAGVSEPARFTFFAKHRIYRNKNISILSSSRGTGISILLQWDNLQLISHVKREPYISIRLLSSDNED